MSHFHFNTKLPFYSIFMITEIFVTSLSVLVFSTSAIAVVGVVAGAFTRILAKTDQINGKMSFLNLPFLLLQLLQLNKIVYKSQYSKGFSFFTSCNKGLILLQIVTILLQVVTPSCYTLLHFIIQYSKGFQRFVTV